MKRTVIISIAVIVLLLAGFFIYRGYKANQEREAVAQQAAREAELTEKKRIEDLRKAEAAAEAKRLAEAQAAEEAAARAAKLAEEQRIKDQEAAAKLAAEKEAARLAAEKEAARIAKEKADAEARRLAEAREREAREAEAARLAAIKKLDDEKRAAEQAKKLAQEKERARLEALRRQAELAELERANSLLSRFVYPEDYKRRRHYYMNVELRNAEILSEPLPAEEALKEAEEKLETAKP